jgi:hypothetical protein
MALNFPISLVGKRFKAFDGFGNASRSFDGTNNGVDLLNRFTTVDLR